MLVDLYDLLQNALGIGQTNADFFYSMLLHIFVAVVCFILISLPFIIIYKVVEIISEGVK